jgi:hypothetical protein
VQRSYKSPKNLDMKFRAYWNAYRYADRSEMPTFPTVVFVAIYTEFADAYHGVIAKLPAEARELFEVTTLDNLSSVFV